MKHIAWVFSGFQTHSDRCRFDTETVRGGCGLGGRASRARILWVLGGRCQDFSNLCRCGEG